MFLKRKFLLFRLISSSNCVLNDRVTHKILRRGAKRRARSAEQILCVTLSFGTQLRRNQFFLAVNPPRRQHAQGTKLTSATSVESPRVSYPQRQLRSLEVTRETKKKVIFFLNFMCNLVENFELHFFFYFLKKKV